MEHEHTSCPQQHLARIRIQTQRKAALRVSMEDDDMFTMFRWTAKTMDQNEKSIDSEREKYQKNTTTRLVEEANAYQCQRFLWRRGVEERETATIDI